MTFLERLGGMSHSDLHLLAGNLGLEYNELFRARAGATYCLIRRMEREQRERVFSEKLRDTCTLASAVELVLEARLLGSELQSQAVELKNRLLSERLATLHKNNGAVALEYGQQVLDRLGDDGLTDEHVDVILKLCCTSEEALVWQSKFSVGHPYRDLFFLRAAELKYHVVVDKENASRLAAVPA